MWDALALLLVSIGAACARAATYGNSIFSGSDEGWKTTKAECSVPLPLACSDSGEYSGTAGNPPGAPEAKGTIP